MASFIELLKAEGFFKAENDIHVLYRLSRSALDKVIDRGKTYHLVFSDRREHMTIVGSSDSASALIVMMRLAVRRTTVLRSVETGDLILREETS